jgi:hypothetical protein
MDRDLLRTVDNWRRGQDEIPSRAEAVRRLMSRALVNDHAAA